MLKTWLLSGRMPGDASRQQAVASHDESVAIRRAWRYKENPYQYLGSSTLGATARVRRRPRSDSDRRSSRAENSAAIIRQPQMASRTPQ
jgi:hypothetical protein